MITILDIETIEVDQRSATILIYALHICYSKIFKSNKNTEKIREDHAYQENRNIWGCIVDAHSSIFYDKRANGEQNGKKFD